ncbi:hypothetical protein Taro_011919 [Colocasia esculenta]|uniref:Hflx-type G domain-containing protein n=1 Tax=Colocasia esculenta TaxID=4460 RepID=A0A843U7I6_COLES|nr:hypothetical protein [Colocasia esculenta]
MFRAISRLCTSTRSFHQAVSSIPPLSPAPQLSSALRCPLHASPPSSAPCSRQFSSSRRRRTDEGREEDGGGDGLFLLANKDPERSPRLFVVQPRLRPDSLLDWKLSEALNLANSLEEQRDGFYAEEFADKEPPPHVVVQNPLSRSLRAHADTYFGPGTVETVKTHIKALSSKASDELDAVFVNAILSGIQQRNLEAILDRVGLIIEIFNAHAETKEAKLQSELAALMYKKSRLVRIRGPDGRLTFGASGEAQVVSARGRGSGGRGFISGAGETELQLQRRRIQERRIHLLEQIEEVRRTRSLQRSARRRHGGLHGEGLTTVAVVGYTNAGKSTLVSALSRSDLYSDDRYSVLEYFVLNPYCFVDQIRPDDEEVWFVFSLDVNIILHRLFATVDPRLKSVILPSGRKVLLSDTVGFISDLPVQLVEAFHATLEEVVEADLLMIDLVEGKNGDHRYLNDGHLDESCDRKDGDSDDSMASELSSAEDRANGELETVDECSEEVYDANGGAESDVVSEELGTFSEEKDYLSSAKPLNEDETAYGLSSGNVTDEGELIPNSSEEMLADTDGPQNRFLGECQPKGTYCVKTSAILGVGLQELLFLIDEKLNAQKQLQKRNLEPFDRKWRPPHSIEETIVEQ